MKTNSAVKMASVTALTTSVKTRTFGTAAAIPATLTAVQTDKDYSRQSSATTVKATTAAAIKTTSVTAATTPGTTRLLGTAALLQK